MPETNFKKHAQSVIPDDPEASAYRFIIVAAKRARQLQNGARSFLPTTSKKPTVAAMEEVRRGLVQYDDPAFHRLKKNPSKSNSMNVLSASAAASLRTKRRSWRAR